MFKHFNVSRVQGGHIDAEAANVAVSGLSLLTVTSLHLDLSALTMDLRAFMPYLKVSAYKSEIN